MEHKWKLFMNCYLFVEKVNHSYTLSSFALQPWAIVLQWPLYMHGRIRRDMLTCCYTMLSIKFENMLKPVLHLICTLKTSILFQLNKPRKITKSHSSLQMLYHPSYFSTTTQTFFQYFIYFHIWRWLSCT